jgi:hypothetical protein
MRESDEPHWRAFEKAVAAFIATMSRGAKVSHDVRLPDAHTGLPRQRDVWVEWTSEGQTMRALISCKCWANPLDAQDIDHFNGEFISSNADFGIIYSKKGYLRPAIEKAKVLGFACCMLYQDEHPDIPDHLICGLCHHIRPVVAISVTGDVSRREFKKWKNVLGLVHADTSVGELLVQALDRHQDYSDINKRWETVTNGTVVSLDIGEVGELPLNIRLTIRDQVYRALVTYSRVNGSYDVTSDRFLGTQTTPTVDMQSVHPGEGWEEVATPVNPPRSLSYVKKDARKCFDDFGEKDYPSSKSATQ